MCATVSSSCNASYFSFSSTTLLRTRRESANPLWLCQSLLYTTQSVNVVEKEAFLTLITRILFYFLDCLQPHFSYFFSLSHYYSKGKIKTNQSIIHAKLSRVKLTLNWANQQQFRSQIFSPPGPRSPCKNAIQCQSVIKMDVSNIMTTKTFPFEMHLSLWLEASKEIMNIRMRRRKTTELSEDWSSIKRVKRFSQRVQWGALENGLSWVQIPLGSFLCAASLLLCWPVGKLIDTTVHLRFALGGDWGHASGFIPFDVPWMASVLFC